MPKYVKGQSGNPAGKPKGLKTSAITVAKINAAASARTAVALEQLLGKAHSVVDEALDDGNAQVAMWVLDRLIGKNHAMLPEAIEITLSTMDEVMVAAQAVTEMAMQRKLSIDDADRSLKMLSQYANFRAFERIDELKEMIDEMNRATSAKTIDGGATVPQWGRLSEGSETANKQPAE